MKLYKNVTANKSFRFRLAPNSAAHLLGTRYWLTKEGNPNALLGSGELMLLNQLSRRNDVSELVQIGVGSETGKVDLSVIFPSGVKCEKKSLSIDEIAVVRESVCN